MKYRRDQRLPDHLPAEDAALATRQARPAIEIGVDRLDVEQRPQPRDQLFGRRLRIGIHDRSSHRRLPRGDCAMGAEKAITTQEKTA